MSDYAQSIDFSDKDALSSGDPSKRILGADVDVELGLIQTAVNSKTDNVVTTAGDLIRGSAGNLPERLGIGALGQVLHADGTQLSWQNRLIEPQAPVALSGTSVTLSNIPASARKVTLSLANVSKSGAGGAFFILRIGPVAAPESTGYAGVTKQDDTSSGATAWSGQTGAPLHIFTDNTDQFSTLIQIQSVSDASDLWIISIWTAFESGTNINKICHGLGSKALAGVMSQTPRCCRVMLVTLLIVERFKASTSK